MSDYLKKETPNPPRLAKCDILLYIIFRRDVACSLALGLRGSAGLVSDLRVNESTNLGKACDLKQAPPGGKMDSPAWAATRLSVCPRRSRVTSDTRIHSRG